MQQYVTVTNSEQGLPSLVHPFKANNMACPILALRTPDDELFTEVAARTNRDDQRMIYADLVGDDAALATQVASVMLAGARHPSGSGLILTSDAFECDMRGPPASCPSDCPCCESSWYYSFEYEVLVPLPGSAAATVQRCGLLGFWWSAALEVTPACDSMISRRWSPMEVYENRLTSEYNGHVSTNYDTTGTPRPFTFTVEVRLEADRMFAAMTAAGMEPPADLVRDALLLTTGIDVPPFSCTTSLAFRSAVALLMDRTAAKFEDLEGSHRWWSTKPEIVLIPSSDDDNDDATAFPIPIVDPTEEYERVMSAKVQRALRRSAKSAAYLKKTDRAPRPGTFKRKWGGKWQDRPII